jgi:hypothetical protein
MTICPFSKYRDIFGIPSQGVHQYRFLNTAIVDYALAIIMAFLVARFTKIPLVLATILVLVVGIILHMLFGVNTSAIKYLGLSC